MDKRVIVLAYVLIAVACLSLIYLNANKNNPSMTSFSVKYSTICVDANKSDDYLNDKNCVKADDSQCKAGEIGIKCSS